MPDIFLWTLSDGPYSRTIILWDRTVIVIVGNPGGRSVKMSAHEDHVHARDEALDHTETEEGFGLTLTSAIGARGWSGLKHDITTAHKLYLIGRQQEALTALVQVIARQVIDEGTVLA